MSGSDLTPKPHTLIAAACVEPGERVLDLGAEGKPVGTGLVGSAAEICFTASDLRDIRLCNKEICDRTAANIRAVLDDSSEEVSGGPFDVALYQPRGWEAKDRVFEWIDRAFDTLSVGGRLCLAARKDRGADSYAGRVRAVFGNLDPLKKGRLRVYRAIKECESPGAAPVEATGSFEVVDLPGGPYTFETRAGVFSRTGLDRGTRYLIESTAIPHAGARILDLGCGYGATGIVCARTVPSAQVQLVDVDAQAVRCARRNLCKNGISNARVDLGDAFETLSDQRFDLILSNPPSHEGSRTAQLFVQGAAAHLAPGGRLALVTMRPGLYSQRMVRAFEAVDGVGPCGGYTILQAVGPRGRP